MDSWKKAIFLGAAAIAVTDAATIYSLEPSRGSLQGGTYLTIWGAGFENNGRDGHTKVYVHNILRCGCGNRGQ
jgi:hypothetical protein